MNYRGSALNRAVSLAAWLIATGRQPPGKAHFIAARKYGVDQHDVARMVGARGGRSASRRRRADHIDANRALTPPTPALPQLLTMLVLTTEPSTTEPGTKVRARIIDGPQQGHQVDLIVAPRWLPSVGVGDRILLEVVAGVDPSGEPWLLALRCLGLVRDDGTLAEPLPESEGRP